MGGRSKAVSAVTIAVLCAAAPAFAGSPHVTAGAPPFTMSPSTSCDPGTNGTSTCTTSVSLNPSAGEAKTSAAVQTGSDGTTADTGEADAAGLATVNLYLSQAAVSATVTLTYQVVATPTAGGTPDNRAGNFISLSATANCSGCGAANTVTLSSSNTTLGIQGAAAGSQGSIQVTITNPSGGLLPKGTVRVWARSESSAFIGTGIGTGVGNAFANADNEFLNVALN